MNSINEALMLLAIGMGTVFLVLFFIIYFCKGMIWFINRYLPEEVAATPALEAVKNTAEVPSKVIAAISAAVGVASKGKAKIVKIEKLKK